MNNLNWVLRAKNINKKFVDGEREVQVLSGVDLEIYPHETLAILGSSGSGKSTLLQILSGLDLPSSGEIFVQDPKAEPKAESKAESESNPNPEPKLKLKLKQALDLIPLNLMTSNQRAKIRNQMFGFVYQFHHLLPEFTALENVQIPLLIRGDSRQKSKEIAKNWLDQVGLSHRFDHKPSALSGGERQRVAIARAMVGNPACLLADEPTGNLDSETAGKVFEVLLKCNQISGTALIIVTHDLALANQMQKQVRLISGKLG
jgi:lipoprotein-releasing system ATP-binding protein